MNQNNCKIEYTDCKFILLHQSMSFLLNNNPAKFHSNLIWNDAALGFFAQHRHNKKNNNSKISRDAESVSGQKITTHSNNFKFKHII